MKEQELPAHDLGKESQREEQGRAPWLGNQHGLLSRMGRLELMVRKAGVKRNRGRRRELEGARNELGFTLNTTEAWGNFNLV